MSISEYETITVSRDGAVDRLCLNRPDQLNALNQRMVDELTDYFQARYRDLECRVIVLQAAGRAFCAGLDLKETKIGFKNPREGMTIQHRVGDIYKAMRRCPQPIVCLINGAAAGGGFSLALASDIRIAGESARMNAAFITIGLTGGDMGASYFLPRLVGTSVASELLMTGRFINAERALRVNLVSVVVPNEQLEQAAQPYIDDLLRTTPFGLRMTKECLNLSVDAQSLEAAMAVEDRQQILTSFTADAEEAGTAFFEKRAPSYKDE